MMLQCILLENFKSFFYTWMHLGDRQN